MQRPYADNSSVLQTVQLILDDVKKDGDVALQRLSKKFDSVELTDLQVSEEELKNASDFLAPVGV